MVSCGDDVDYIEGWKVEAILQFDRYIFPICRSPPSLLPSHDIHLAPSSSLSSRHLLHQPPTTPIVIKILPLRPPHLLQPTIRPIIDAIAPGNIGIVRKQVAPTAELGHRGACVSAVLHAVCDNSRDIA